MAAESPSEVAVVAKLVNVILMSAIKKGASHVAIGIDRIVPASDASDPTEAPDASFAVMFWVHGAWHVQLRPPLALRDVLVRRIGVMIGVLPPGRGQGIAGGFTLAIGAERQQRFAVEVQREDTPEGRLAALLQLVDGAHLEGPALPAATQLVPRGDPHR